MVKSYNVMLILILLNINLLSQVFLTDLLCTGGTPTSIYVDKKTDTFYAGCWGGIWKYNGSPGNWTEIDSDPEHNILANAKITVMFIDSKGVFYAGCDDRTQSYISYDGGKKWEQINDFNFTSQKINCIVEHINGVIYLGTNSGIIKTEDNGKTWEKLQGISTAISSLYINKAGIIFAGSSSGLYKTVTDDSNWIKVSLPGFVLPIYTIIDTPSDIIFVGAGGNFYKSEDKGNSWISIVEPMKQYYTNVNVTGLYAINDYRIYLRSGNILFRTDDQAKSWISLAALYEPKTFISPLWEQIAGDSKRNIYGISSRYGLLQIDDNFTSISSENYLLNNFRLENNFPNPFNPSTVISYQLPISGHVQLKIYDLLGSVVATLVDEYKQAGTHNCELRIENGELPSGIYFYTLKAGDYISTKKMVVLK